MVPIEAPQGGHARPTAEARVRTPGDRDEIPRSARLAPLRASAALCVVWLIAIMRWPASGLVVPWDSKNQFYVFFRFLADSLHAGTSPFWNPYHYGGHPSIADPQSLIFSPPFLLWAWLDPSPTMLAFDTVVMLHLLAGALAIVGLGWRRDWTTSATVLAGAVFMLGGAASSRLNHTGIILVLGLFPVALLALEVALERRSALMAIAFALIATVILLGRNQVALMLSMLLVAAALRELVGGPQALRHLPRRLGLLALAGVVIGALAAVPVLLSLDLAQLSNRPDTAIEEALSASLHPANLATLAVPNVFGTHAPSGQPIGYWGPQQGILPDVGATDDSFNYLFVGAVPVVLLLWLGIAGGGLARRGLRLATAVLVLSLLFALGRYAPVYELVYAHVPGFKFFRRPIDGIFLVGLAIGMLSGHLLTDYQKRGLPPASPSGSAFVLAAVVAISASAIAVSAMTQHAGLAIWELARSAAVVGVVIAVLWLGNRNTHGFSWPVRHLFGHTSRALAASLVTLVATAELVGWNTASRFNAEPASYYEVLEHAKGEQARALAVLEAEIARRHLEGARPRVEIVGINGQWQNLPIVRRLESTTGYNPLRIGLYDKYVRPGEDSWFTEARAFPPTFNSYDCALARALGIEYVVLDRPMAKLSRIRQPERIETLLAGPSIWVYRLAGALPRVVFSDVVTVADTDATTVRGDFRFPPMLGRIVIDDETPPTLEGRTRIGAGSAGTARLVSWKPGRVDVEVEARRAGVLVLHDTYYPGWVAEIDGTRVPLLRADVLFRGVELTAGRHRVVFRYAPLTFENFAAAFARVTSPTPRQPKPAQPATTRISMPR